MGLGVAMFSRHEGLHPDSCPRPVSVSGRHAHSSVGMAPPAATVWTRKLDPAAEDGCLLKAPYNPIFTATPHAVMASPVKAWA